MLNNKEVYRSVDFNYWANKERLDDKERFLLEKYLHKGKKTVEAGTAGGRIVLEMKNLGFASLHGFDYVPEFIQQAKHRDSTGSICFAVEDATELSYQDNDFEQLVYLQQIMCCIEDDLARLKAFKEAYRILKKGGTAIFSFLNYEDKEAKPFHNAYLIYLKFLRKLGNNHTSIQYIPRLKVGGKPNFASLIDRKPYMYWYKLEEAYQTIKEANFQVVALGSDLQLSQRKMHRTMEALKQEPLQGMLYFVCQK